MNSETAFLLTIKFDRILESLSGVRDNSIGLSDRQIICRTIESLEEIMEKLNIPNTQRIIRERYNE